MKTDIGPVWLRLLRATLRTVAPEPVTVRAAGTQTAKVQWHTGVMTFAYRHRLRSGSGDPEPTVR